MAGSLRVVQFVYRYTGNLPVFREYISFLPEKREMQIATLIDMAKKRSGMTLGEMAAEIGISQNRITEWKKGQHQPPAGVLAFFAEKAGLNVAETVMEVEKTLDPRFSQIWERALGNLRAAGIAATVTMAPLTSSAWGFVIRIAPYYIPPSFSGVI